MFGSRVHRRFTTWLALLAMVLGALAPTVAQAMAASDDRADWLQVCSVSGMVWVQAGSGQGSDPQSDGGAPMGDTSQHCPWCTLHGGAAGLPASHVLPDLPALAGGVLVPPRLARPANTVWALAQSRAPPLAT